VGGRVLNRKNDRTKLVFIELLVIIAALIYLSPFYFVVVNSFKSFGEIVENAASVPEKLSLVNYVKAWDMISFPRVFLNSVLVTFFSIGGMVLMGAMAAWRIVRRRTPASSLIFVLFISAMVIPFQSVMIPMVKVANLLGLINSLHGVVVIYFGFGMPLTVFLLHGYVKSIPRELEDSAYIDGCTTVQTFFHIVLPLLQTMIVTVIILQTLWIWNDFLLPLLVLFSEKIRTIPLGIFSFFGQHMNRWDWALSTLIMGMVPVILFFLFLQRFIIKGITAGSVKA
jgi:raffinose/stachyose/melibiose transport system permease protein